MKSKKAYLEAIRLFAIFFVLYVHTGVNAVSHYQIAGGKASGTLAFFMMCVAQTCNVLFFMVSGAVLLHRKESLRKVMIRFLKMAVVVILFSLLQYACNYFRMPAMGFDLGVFFEFIYHQTVITQYWFLYEYLAFLIILPFLRILAEKLNKDYFLYLLGLYLVLEGILPLTEYFWENEAFALNIPFMLSILFYPLVGYFAEHNEGNILESKRNLVAINVAACVSLIINIWYAGTRYLETGYGESFMGMTMVLALAIFVDIRYLFKRCRVPKKLEKVIIWCGSGVFGVCLLEPQLREGFYFLYERLEPVIRWLPATVIWLLAAMAAGIIIMNLLKKIPVLRKLF